MAHGQQLHARMRLEEPWEDVAYVVIAVGPDDKVGRRLLEYLFEARGVGGFAHDGDVGLLCERRDYEITQDARGRHKSDADHSHYAPDDAAWPAGTAGLGSCLRTPSTRWDCSR